MRRQCELLGIQRSTVYYKPADPSDEQREHEETLMARIDYWHTEMPYLGTRKMVRQLREDGHTVGRKLVRRLMAQMGIHALYPKANLSKRNFKESIVPYLLRNKSVFLPNQVWSIDITYIKMRHGHMYPTGIAVSTPGRPISVSQSPGSGMPAKSVRQSVRSWNGSPRPECVLTSCCYRCQLGRSSSLAGFGIDCR